MAVAEPMDLGYIRSLGLPTVAAHVVLPAQASQLAPAAPRKPEASRPAAQPAAQAAAAKVVAKPAPKQAAKAPSAPAAPSASHPGQAPTGGNVTEHVFLTDTSLVELDGCLLLDATKAEEVPKDAPEGTIKLTVVLSRTVFHPQGGGQPADTGSLTAEGLPELAVSFTSCRKEDGAILHDCLVPPAAAATWTKAVGGSVQVRCSVDSVRRKLCARLHSAGHLLDAAVSAVQPPLKWVPGKGFHFPDGPYVEYVLNDDSRKFDLKKPAEKDAVLKEIQANIDRLISTGGKVDIEYKDGLRHVAMGGEECPCGGTHVADVSDIGKVEVRKMAGKQGNMRISYQVAAAA